MLILIYGEDFAKKKIKVKTVLDSMKKKRPDAMFLHFDYLDISVEQLAELTQTAGLFEQKNIIFLTNIFKNKEIKKFFLNNLEIFEKSDNAFVLSEDIITPAVLKKIEKIALKTYAFPLQKKEVNVFVFSNYLQKKDKKNLWLFYRQQISAGIAPENIFGIMMWSLKTLATKNSYSWKKEEIEEKIFSAIIMFHKSRFSGLKLENSLEKFILDL